MDTQLSKYQTFRNLIKTFLYRGGIWYYREDKVFFYGLSTFVIFCLISSLAFKVLFFSFLNVGNVSLFIESFRNALALFAPMIRIVYYTVYRNELVTLDKELGSKFEEELKNEKNQPALLKKISTYYKFMYFQVISTMITAFFILFPIYYSIFKHKIFKRILQGNYPFPIKSNSPIYWTVICLESIMYYFVVNVLNGVDVAFGLHCFRISGLLRLIATRLNSLNPCNPNWKDQLKECVKIHQLTIRSKEPLQKVYGGIIMWNYCFSAVIMCSLLWQINQAKSHIPVPKLIFVIAYMTLKLVQCYVYSYSGSNVTLESEHYQEAVWTSGWPQFGNVRLTKDLLFILTQRTITLKSFGYFYITMEMFEKICNTTISYFFLLQNIDAKR